MKNLLTNWLLTFFTIVMKVLKREYLKQPNFNDQLITNAIWCARRSELIVKIIIINMRIMNLLLLQNTHIDIEII
jgi:hypothetical protein